MRVKKSSIVHKQITTLFRAVAPARFGVGCPALPSSRRDPMSGPKYPGFDTLSLHAGATPDPATGARATPVYFTSSYAFRDSDHAASLFNMERAGHVYSRSPNPTNVVLEERSPVLEG